MFIVARLLCGMFIKQKWMLWDQVDEILSVRRIFPQVKMGWDLRSFQILQWWEKTLIRTPKPFLVWRDFYCDDFRVCWELYDAFPVIYKQCLVKVRWSWWEPVEMISLNRCCITVTSVQFPTCRTHFSVSPCNLSSENLQWSDITPV